MFSLYESGCLQHCSVPIGRRLVASIPNIVADVGELWCTLFASATYKYISSGNQTWQWVSPINGGLNGNIVYKWGISIATFDYQRVYHSRFVWLWNSTGKETPRFARELLKVLQPPKLEEGSFVSIAQVILNRNSKFHLDPTLWAPETRNQKKGTIFRRTKKN